MKRLRDFNFEESYDKGENDLAEEFYLPCMRSATQYDRISGYFSSAVFSIAWPALKEFVNAGGRMRIICSPVFSEGDLTGLREGQEALENEELSKALVAELRILLNGDRSRKPTRVLAGLIASGVIDIRLALMNESASASDRRMFHDKVGIFRDSSNDSVGFRGSMNETYLGLAADGNLESIDVFTSWTGERDGRRLDKAQNRFQSLWDDEAPGVRVRHLSDAAKKLIREAGSEDWEVLVDEVIAESAIRAKTSGAARPLRDHQVQALAAWQLNGRQGLLEHATGSGKTYTAINAIRSVIEDSGKVLVLVPSALLLTQWQRELNQYLSDLNPQILLAGDGHDDWRRRELLRPWTAPGDGCRITLATIATASSEAFRARVHSHQRLLVVADEAHRLGSPQARNLLTLDAGWRLGLSATPRRAGDSEGSAAILEYFGGILHPPYSLTDAIRDRVLTPYTYHPHPVPLTPAEQDEYDEISRRIRRESGRRGDALDDLEANERLRRLAIARARVLKRAAGKVDMARRVLLEHWQDGQRWLVYCDGLAQLQQVRSTLAAAGLPTLEYHSGMAGDREATLAELELNGGIVVSIRCLDEGIDLPAVTHALILASSRNPREFIQRRGRILRRYPGKTIARLHDAITTPSFATNSPAEGLEYRPRASDRLLAGELGRVLDFAHGAANPQALTQVEQICIQHGVRVAASGVADAADGVETEDDDD
ncbi:DNA-repair protein [Actinoplanes sp. OR16]|uniref:DEAD/DEAH box helicase family protein n=1 Tax=Actinoplanes sp. OR16 TaxID=946334 RepID=UPI000F703866|nr:DEAD/DEAH box helicase family protein [Actinoplanes sp. OR16]BBH65303.1 DNA-repair protein [Actinoplanes sp. OR16]